MAYTLMNGEKVENLTFHATGVEAWEQSQYYWWNGQKVCDMFNSETGEIKTVDARGNDIVYFSYYK